MNGKKVITRILILTICSLLVANGVLAVTSFSEGKDYHFTLTAKIYGWTDASTVFQLLKPQLDMININLEVIKVGLYPPWENLQDPDYSPNYDLVYASFSIDHSDPDYSEFYSQQGMYNIFRYNSQMDWSNEYSSGINEWYLNNGTNIYPINSEERRQHYFEWQNYLMDEILPSMPVASKQEFQTHWSNLNGFNISKGVIQSWGDINFDGSHMGQITTDELVTVNDQWINLNPLRYNDSVSDFICNSIMDPLIWVDGDGSVWPHLAADLEHLSDTHIRITVRNDVKWALDPDGLFPSEYLTSEDIYFTLYCWKELSKDPSKFFWLEDMRIINETTIDLFIDSNLTTITNEPYYSYLYDLNTLILPEHYLNQTQLIDNKTPDKTHQSWSTFEEDCFGTALFSFNYSNPYIETNLIINSDCWWLNNSITNDLALNFENRFGNFNDGYLNQLRLRYIPDIITENLEFQAGKLDLTRIVYDSDFVPINTYDIDEYVTQQQAVPKIKMVAFNLNRENKLISSKELCPNDPNMTIGLAIRKAIAYACNKEEIVDIGLGKDEYKTTDYPICERYDYWLNPVITNYPYNIEKAKEYLTKAGYTDSNLIGTDDYLYLIPLGFMCFIIIEKIRKRRKHHRTL